MVGPLVYTVTPWSTFNVAGCRPSW